MKLSAPSRWVFLVSTLIIVLLIASKFFGAHVPILTAIVKSYPLEVTFGAWFLLFLGVAFNI